MIPRKLYFLIAIAVFSILLFSGKVFAQKVCFQCHEKSSFQNRIVHQPVAKGKCTTCHNPHVAKHAGLIQQKTDELCYSCHSKQAKSFKQGVIHDPVRRGTCSACHDPHSSKSKGLLKGKMIDSCFNCHEGLSRKYKVTHQPYAKGQCNKCHKPHQSDNYLLLRKSEPAICRSCHSKSEIDGAHRNYPVKLTACLSCHNPHGSEQKALIRNVKHAPYTEDCGSCHKSSKSRVSQQTCLECHEEINEQLSSFHNHLLKGNSCMNCHSPHAGDSELLLKGRQIVICRRCHEDTFRRHENSKFVHTDSVKECNTCHAVHGTNEMALLKGDSNEVCLRCHESQGQFSHPVGTGVTDPRNNQIVTCVSCHTPHGSNYKGELKLSGEEALCVQCHHM